MTRCTYKIAIEAKNVITTEQKEVKSLDALLESFTGRFDFATCKTAQVQLSRKRSTISKCGKCVISYTDEHVTKPRGMQTKRTGAATENQKSGHVKKQKTMQEEIERDGNKTTVAKVAGKKTSETLTAGFVDGDGIETTKAKQTAKKNQTAKNGFSALVAMQTPFSANELIDEAKTTHGNM